MGAVLVAQKGAVLLRQGYGMANLEHQVLNHPETKFRLGSVTKQFTAASILQLQERGLLQVEQPVSVYLPVYPQGERITVHQLLNHTAGIPNYTSFSDFGERKRIAVSLDDVLSWFSEMPLEFTPGEQYRYSNSGYVLLSKIIETVSGESYADYLQHHIFEPLGMVNSGYDRYEPILPHRAVGYHFSGEAYQHADFIDMSIPVGAGALYSTIDDLYKWDQALYTDMVLSESSKNQMFAPTVSISPDSETEYKAYYGYGWVQDTHYKRNRLAHNGRIDGFSATIARYPESQTTIIALSNLETSSINYISHDLAAIVFGEPYELPKQRQAIKLDPAIYQAYVGKYQFMPEMSLTITAEEQKIFAQLTGQSRYEIFPETETVFFYRVVEAQLTFVMNKDRAVSVILQQSGQAHEAVRVD